ncbi:hypothetical protein B4134_2122 [Bacillus safensis]|nr:hypothetical protein B4134_2122 [Bacillus safensis]
MKVLYNDDFIEERVLMWKVETEAINLKKHREMFLPLQNKEESELSFYRSRDKTCQALHSSENSSRLF